MIPFHRPLISEEEISAAAEVLRSGWITAGKKTEEFEAAFSAFKENSPAVAVSSCTAGLFLLLNLLDLEPGDQVITTPFTFAATANTILHNGAKVVFADIDSETLNIDPDSVLKNITARTRAVVCVHTGGNPCNMEKLAAICSTHRLELIEDCAHALETRFQNKHAGTFGLGGAFSFYPTKNITAIEGGMILINRHEYLERLQRMRRHGIDADAWQRQSDSDYRFYDVADAGYKMNMTDVQAVIGLNQLKKVEKWHDRRKSIAHYYDEKFSSMSGVILQKHQAGGEHAHHLYILRLDKKKFGDKRNLFLKKIQEKGVQISVNYQSLHLFAYFREKLGFRRGDFPNAELCSDTCFSIPFYPGLSDEEVERVAGTVASVLKSA